MDASLAVTLWCFCLKFSREKGKARKMIAPTVLLVKSLPYQPTSGMQFTLSSEKEKYVTRNTYYTQTNTTNYSL